jgi:hypothetical protein
MPKESKEVWETEVQTPVSIDSHPFLCFCSKNFFTFLRFLNDKIVIASHIDAVIGIAANQSPSDA